MSPHAPPDPGWQIFPEETELLDWLNHVRGHALAAVGDPPKPDWLRHGGTWYAGVDVLPNDAEGRVAGGPPLRCGALDQAGALPLHHGQVSVTFAGYPAQDLGESDAAHRYRRDRDAAHLDGLLPVGPARRRMIREPHAWILGLPLTPMDRRNAPLVVWEGSQEILRASLCAVLAPYPPKAWPEVDVTEAYQVARRRCFDICRRVEIEAVPGQAILLHRLVLHGVAPWTGPSGPPRSVLYFRPILPGGIADWLACP